MLKRWAWYGTEQVEIIRDYKTGSDHLFSIRRPNGAEVLSVKAGELLFANSVKQIYVWKDGQCREHRVKVIGERTDNGQVFFTIRLPWGDIMSRVPQGRIEIRTIKTDPS